MLHPVNPFELNSKAMCIYLSYIGQISQISELVK